MNVEIWGKLTCTFCDAAIKLCEEKGIEYEYKTYEIYFTKEEILAEFVGATTFPQIKISLTRFLGFLDLYAVYT